MYTIQRLNRAGNWRDVHSLKPLDSLYDAQVFAYRLRDDNKHETYRIIQVREEIFTIREEDK